MDTTTTLATTDGGGGGGENQVSPTAPAPVPVSNANAPPPFLSKTYDMVDDAETNAIVSWSPTNNSFIVWNPPEFARDLLPKYFKHNNFSSFVRQLNTYGFRKVDPDRWEFANEGFLRGQKHLLRSINRRKPAHGQGNQQSQPSHGQSSSMGACVEVGKFGLEEEVEILKRDKNVLMQELVRLRQQQQTTDNQLQATVQRLQGMEQRQQQMMSFLAKAVQSPGFLAQFVQQQQNESNRRINEANKKRRIRQEGGDLQSEFSAASDGQIVKYQPMMNDAAMAMLRQIMKMDTSSVMDSFDNSPGNFLISDGSSSSTSIDSKGPSSRPSGVKLQEVFPTSGSVSEASVTSGGEPSAVISELQSSTQLVTSETVTTAPFRQGVTSVPKTIQEDIVMPEVPQIPEMVPEGISLENNILLPDFSDSFNLDEASLGDIDLGPDISELLDNSFWDDLIMQSPALEESSPNGLNDEARPIQNGSNKNQNMDKLTEQMGLLSSHTKKV